ncbi:tRNA (adenosine(37)-N6)-threonylcarbamoyltransferase complex dimerization subunit type 1 TsaB [Phytopseudomonas dryadis]|uniref:tRNA threonylcarbamoyladenosine biosynthesis protein TsaB n=1 Tax=Phytopseudomonas dryadis TaxID=2487520 RepID=A0A4Q9R769_9GAMM|nr:MULTISPECIES: tRNA (adenosine(37)-N6)-threonylcarbamoyltransferase complex dimerization subunit type 1 TsaB [Pseudomonas]TBU96436.1 tRNA (adenosine(37)-N6)-threonylcarbamoyltransferase complex dimerization subunit type 1 TsaB [Pseudomonas dryadis]TBV03507.1 tRNA (adenosine(37)-N6)-threonylcarbamoyltransferase complex dimerization subunit type 1 TsaB [Pseudomonas dryadis]TBV16559.1 tRNA (adenosine(37)-N6)-threonylcarbamoyltransferase complex dimerization subunit type 1 TsaB [Pseudomonas sp. FR
MTTLLALDTATEACSVALLHDGKVSSHYEVIPRLHAQRLLPMIKALLEQAGVPLSALDAIAFGRGPGAFTGVRIAIGVVQGLAFALDRPVLPVSNLAVLAQRALREHGASQVAAAIDARMDELYWGCYRAEQGEMRLAGVEAVLAPERAALPHDASGDWFAAGTGWGSFASRIAVPVSGQDGAMLPHAEDLLSLARFAWARGEALVADLAQPVYLRDQVATPRMPPPA